MNLFEVIQMRTDRTKQTFPNSKTLFIFRITVYCVCCHILMYMSSKHRKKIWVDNISTHVTDKKNMDKVTQT